MRGGSTARAHAAALLALLLVAPLAAAYHGETGSMGLVATGPIEVEGDAVARAMPGTVLFEGIGDVELDVLQGVARVRIVEERESVDPTLRAAGVARETRTEAFELPSPRIVFGERALAFAALLFTDGGLTSFHLESSRAMTLEREPPALLADVRGFPPQTSSDGVRVLAPRGVVSAAGDFSLFLYGADVRFASADAHHDERLGEWTERTATGDVRVVRHAVVELRQARLVAPFSSGFSGLRAEAVDLEYDGVARLASARGQAVVGDRAPVADGGGVSIAGILAASAWPTRGGDPSLRFEAQGDVTALTVGPESQSFLRDPEAAAAASLLVLVLGALAWWWPLLKTGALAPLYARVNGVAVMDHEGRERAFAYVKAHPGASVNDVADGLDIAWSTAMYHLRVLEREGFVAGERRGRHRRYFAVGEGSDREAAFAAAHPTARRILDAVAASPGLSQKELAALAGVTASTAAWHLERLRDGGFVLAARDWRAVRYAPGPRLVDARRVPDG